MAIAALVFAALAALVHVYIWVLESLLWTAARTRAVFGTSEEEAETTKLLALNQGFYNLFLAVIAAASLPLSASLRSAMAFSIARRSPSPIFEPCSASVFSVEWTRASA